MQILQIVFIIQLNCLPKAHIINPAETKNVTESWNCEGSKSHSLNWISSLQNPNDLASDDKREEFKQDCMNIASYYLGILLHITFIFQRI